MSHSVAQNLAQFKPGTLFVGVDLGLDRNVAKVLDERARVLATVCFGHTRGEYDRFYERMQSLVQRQQASGYVVGMEPTNFFWKLLANDMEAHQVPYRLVNALTVHKHREGDQLDRSKDDPRDAFTIADLLRTGKFTTTQLLHGDHAELRDAVALHERLCTEIARQRNLIWAVVGQVFPELTTVFKDLTGITAQALLRNCAAAAALKTMKEEELLARLAADAQGHRLARAKLLAAHRLAGESVGLTDGLRARQEALRCYLRTLEVLQAQEAEVRQKVCAAFVALPEAQYMCSIHALGAMTCAGILAEIGDFGRFASGTQLAKLAGIQPTPNTSGRKERSKTPMSHQGRGRLRTLLYMACLRLVKKDESFARDYRKYQERKANPLTKMQALGALMNRLLRILYALVQHQRHYDPAYARSA